MATTPRTGRAAYPDDPSRWGHGELVAFVVEAQAGPAVVGSSTVPLAVLEDRYAAALRHPVTDDPRGTQRRLWRALEDLIDATTRAPRTDGGMHQDQRGEWVDLMSECSDLVREHIIRRVHETGIAR